MPSLFLAHGSPMIAIEDNAYTRLLQQTGRRIRPQAVVVFTAHWERETTTVSFLDGTYETIYDFGGFPDELYQVVYPAVGSPAHAARVEAALQQASIPVARDYARGLDHGSWTLLKHLYPQADVPVVQVSVNPFAPPAEQYRIGRALMELAKEEILVLGSGVTVHNLRMIRWGQREPEAWATAFDDWLIDKIGSGDTDSLFRYETEAPYAQTAVPRAEHFVPLLIAMGSGSGEPQVLYRSYDFGSISYLCFAF